MEKKINEERDTLIYTLTHELKTTVREIKLLAQFIREDNEERIETQSAEDLRKIDRICDGMNDMFQKLMEYEKARFKRLDEEPVSMSQLIRQCFEQQMLLQDKRKILLEVSELPDITADLLLVKLVIMNILSNAVKYTAGKKKAVIKVFCRKRNRMLEYHFRDNGIGFDMKYAGKIFEPFYRLQNENEFEGNGIGLATVQKIMTRFRGNVRIEGWQGEGCEITLLFPEEMEYFCAKEGNPDQMIRIGIIGDMSGVAVKEERGKTYAYKMAAEEINASGGILGRKVELLFRDDRSDDERTREAAEDLLEKCNVDVLMGSTLSPSRQIMSRAAHRAHTLYLNTQQTEGGVCSHYTFCLSAMPEQQMEKMIQYLIENYGPKCYIAAADYNYGILSAEWVKHIVRQLGGEVAGIEYMDNTTNDFQPIIDRIIQLKVDFVFSMCVFPNQDQFYLQWYEKHLNHIPNATTQVAAEFDQNVSLPAPVLENVYVMASFLEESTGEKAKIFTERFRKICSKEMVSYMNMDTETAYTAMYLYKAAVEMAGTTETEAVINALESGLISYDGPGGLVTVRGEDHHTIRSMSCFRFDKEHRAQELFRTEPMHSEYIETMIEKNTGIKGGLKVLGANAGNNQYNMLLDKVK